jgi:hypothetical protein
LYYVNTILTFNNLHLMFEHDHDDNPLYEIQIRYYDHLLLMW